LAIGLLVVGLVALGLFGAIWLAMYAPIDLRDVWRRRK
jgi:hypothetical protein